MKVCARRVQHPRVEQPGAEGQQGPGNQIRAGDHLLAPQAVEQVAQQQRAGQVTDRERETIQRNRIVADVVELGEHQGVGEEDRVVQERLGDHQRGAEDRPLGVPAECHAQQRQVSVPFLRLDDDGGAFGDRLEVLPVPHRDFLDAPHLLLGLFYAAVGDEPPRAFRQVAPHEDDDDGQSRPDQERHPPAFGRPQRVEQQEGRRTCRGSRPSQYVPLIQMSVRPR